MQFSRWIKADYEVKETSTPSWTIDPDAILDDARLEARFQQIEEEVRRIEVRGGRVLFFCMNSSGAVRDEERRYFPRQDYWDRWVAQRFQHRVFHFEDYVEISSIECADGSHLDFRDVARVSEWVAAVLLKAP